MKGDTQRWCPCSKKVDRRWYSLLDAIVGETVDMPNLVVIAVPYSCISSIFLLVGHTPINDCFLFSVTFMVIYDITYTGNPWKSPFLALAVVSPALCWSSWWTPYSLQRITYGHGLHLIYADPSASGSPCRGMLLVVSHAKEKWNPWTVGGFPHTHQNYDKYPWTPALTRWSVADICRYPPRTQQMMRKSHHLKVRVASPM